MITQKEVRELFKYNKETGILKWRNRGKGRRKTAIAGNINSKGYIVVCVKGKTYKAHGLIWLGMTGAFPTNQIDHINRIKTDNRWQNLRDISTSQNNRNKGLQKNNTSGVKGVCFNKKTNKWEVYIANNNKKRVYLGLYKNFNVAIQVRNKAEQMLGFY
jgi:hypothetical protein